MDDHTSEQCDDERRRVFIATWQARDRVAVFSVNSSLAGAVEAAQEYGDRLNSQNAAYHLHRTHPNAEHHLARWSDNEGTHQIFIASKVVKP
jgi:hypothetical protein